MRSAFPVLTLLLAVPLTAACSSSNGGANAPTDAATGPASDAWSQAGDDAAPGSDAGGDAGPTSDAGACTAARDALLNPVDSVSQGAVTVLSDTGGVKTIYVDASAGGTQASDTNPRVYVSLETASRVALTDTAAETSTAWDLALKRAVVFTNDGEGGPGQGGAAFLSGKAFDAVASSDAASAPFSTEKFLDADCNPLTDPVGDMTTTFSGWYDYNQQEHTLAPHDGTFVVKGASGKIYKVGIVTYYGEADGGTGTAGGGYILKVAAL